MLTSLLNVTEQFMILHDMTTMTSLALLTILTILATLTTRRSQK